MKKQELKVGILFSLTGTTSITERGQYQASLLAIRHINDSGGINGKTLVPMVEDAASDPDIAYQKAEKLIVSDQVTAIIGCYTAACRKKLIPILERYNILLFYPTINEGGEQHPNIFYSNSSPNQQLLDFIPWLIQNVGKSFYLLGSDYIYPREINRYVRLLVQFHGGSICGEEYVALGNQIFDNQISEIRRMNPDIIFSTLVGDSTISYYQQHDKQGLHQAIASNVTAETEIEAIVPNDTAEYYSCFSYFNSIENANNKRFLTEFKRIYGTDTVSSVMECTYNSVFLLAEALKKINTVSTDSIRSALSGLSFEAPQGKIMVDSLNQHVWLNSRIGKVNESGKFTILWESEDLIEPIPFLEHALSDEIKYSGGSSNTQYIESKITRHLSHLSGLKKALAGIPYPFAYFDEDGVLLEIFNHDSSIMIPSFLRELHPGDTVDRGALDKTGIGRALKKDSFSYEVTDERDRKYNITYVMAGFPIKGNLKDRKGVLGVFIPNEDLVSTKLLLTSIESIVYLCADLADSKEEQLTITDALNGITDHPSESLFIIKEGNIRFQNQMAIELWKRKRHLVNSVLQELSSEREENMENGDRIIRREDADESYEIKVSYTNCMHFIYFKALPQQLSRFSLKVRSSLTTNDLIGSSELFLKTIELARSASQIQANTLLLGESGTGKEMFARVIHNESSRKDKPFVAVNCGAISKELINSELFGYVEGAFTGAKKGGSPGKFEIANGGTLFLDEIGEMPLELQTTLLRVLQEKEVVRVGGHKPIPLDVRIIAATNKDLFQEIAFNGSFRSDLYYRLNVFTIELTPLRERPEDIAKLSNHYLEEFSTLTGQKKELTEDTLTLMLKYNWPGNIRELCNIIERAFYLSAKSSIITPEHLPQVIVRDFQTIKVKSVEHDSILTINSINDIKHMSDENERKFYIRMLMNHKGNISKTAQHLGISRTTLYHKLKEYRIQTGRGK
ncbi:transporter substrate-binding protein [Domibacillus mangrovi]|uniref:Sigma-54-dependent Fis family transcriptional regulator n=1 Tax=Domibacillus mangrovi TaxID=1714354 RepID=A0A1Q5P3A8_9BACI|nr:transporter substrate-binding protein [Domibacillus mangrovi]OKL36678.1 sigma-54-dependent Fis family transcriptional regulator [Domibacillus mangrovi]